MRHKPLGNLFLSVALKQPRVIGATQPRCGFDERIQHDLQIERRVPDDFDELTEDEQQRILGHLNDTNDVQALSFGLNALVLIGCGLLLGAAGSGLTLRRFLKV